MRQPVPRSLEARIKQLLGRPAYFQTLCRLSHMVFAVARRSRSRTANSRSPRIHATFRSDGHFGGIHRRSVQKPNGEAPHGRACCAVCVTTFGHRCFACDRRAGHQCRGRPSGLQGANHGGTGFYLDRRCGPWRNTSRLTAEKQGGLLDRSISEGKCSTDIGRRHWPRRVQSWWSALRAILWGAWIVSGTRRRMARAQAARQCRRE